MTYHSHSSNPAGNWHLLRMHLAEVAKLALTHAGAAPWANEASLAGLLHDLGKYADRFQRRLEGQDAGLDHWSQGAWIALSKHKAEAFQRHALAHHQARITQQHALDRISRLLHDHVEWQEREAKGEADTSMFGFMRHDFGKETWDWAIARLLLEQPEYREHVPACYAVGAELEVVNPGNGETP
ncbi:MAG: HDIG domain-containing protein [Gammaproteobacteria bacterium]|nr:HDIG domain-containing protein [Gammaproteobacteria bacterium]